MPESVRDRLFQATIRCVARTGLAKLRVEDVAKEARLGRATIYRHFPGGRDQLVRETITWEVGRFFARLAQAVEDAPDLRTRLEQGVMFAHRAMLEHEALQRVLRTDRESFLPKLNENAPLVVALIRSYLIPYLEAEPLRPGVDAEEAADYLARMVLSYIPSGGRWDLEDPAEVRELVERQFLSGIVAL